ncbi:MAG: Gfo/Idh/MocA family oxidoreductase [Chitinophagaceae bacterium]|nr:Gfo/Idh/MocA family oxidoreductase [Chitinophagaceae bacterium]
MNNSFVIIGCGKIAERHAQQIIKLGKLVAVCDTDVSRADHLAQKYSAKAYYTIESLLQNENEITVAAICTPNGLHAQHSILCLQDGINVLCEKPICINTNDGLAMIEAAKIANKKLFIVKSSRYTPCITALKKVVEHNGLGKIFSFQLNCVWNRPDSYYANSWKGTLVLDGGTLYTQFSHYIDVLLWLLGDVEAVNGFRTNAWAKQIEFEDTGAVAVKMLSGAIGTLHYSVNAFQKNHEVSLTIVAEKGTIKLGGEYMNEVIYQNPQLIDVQNLAAGNLPNDYGQYKGSMSNHDKVYENIVKALNGDESAVTDGASALKSVAFIEKIYQQIPL